MTVWAVLETYVDASVLVDLDLPGVGRGKVVPLCDIHIPVIKSDDHSD